MATTDENLKAALEASLGVGSGVRDFAVTGGPCHDPSLGLWPSPSSLIHVQHGKHRYYRFTDGSHPDLVGSTTAIKAVLGLSKEPLVAWAAKVEREACLEAASKVYIERYDDQSKFPRTPREFRQAIGEALGEVKAHQKILDQAADLGSAAHDMIRWSLQKEMGQDPGPRPFLTEPSLRAFSSFQEWWRSSKLQPVRMEQAIYDLQLGYGGTADIIVECPEHGLGIIDLKTSKAVYAEMHVQVASYMHAARNFADVKWGAIVRLPKSVQDANFEVVPLGKLYDRTLSEPELLEIFRSALVVFRLLCHQEPK